MAWGLDYQTSQGARGSEVHQCSKPFDREWSDLVNICEHLVTWADLRLPGPLLEALGQPQAVRPDLTSIQLQQDAPRARRSPIASLSPCKDR